MPWDAPMVLRSGGVGHHTALRLWRARTGCTLRELATRTGVSYRTLLRVSAGEPLNGLTAVRVARVTGIPVVDLVSQGR